MINIRLCANSQVLFSCYWFIVKVRECTRDGEKCASTMLQTMNREKESGCVHGTIVCFLLLKVESGRTGRERENQKKIQKIFPVMSNKVLVVFVFYEKSKSYSSEVEGLTLTSGSTAMGVSATTAAARHTGHLFAPVVSHYQIRRKRKGDIKTRFCMVRF